MPSSLFALATLLLVLGAASAAPPALYGQSTEDMVGAFSIEKTIRLGDSGCFFGDRTLQADAQGEIENQRVNVTEHPQDVGLTMEMKGSHPTNAHALFISPTGQEELAIELLPAGASTYHGSANLPVGSEPGLWRLARVEYLEGDQMRNITDPQELSFWVESIDRHPPHLMALLFEPKTFYRLDPNPIEFQLKVSDSSSLSPETNARFVSPSGSQRALVRFTEDGAGCLILPPDVEPGAWMLLNLTLFDMAGNGQVLCREDMIEAGLPAEFIVV